MVLESSLEDITHELRFPTIRYENDLDLINSYVPSSAGHFAIPKMASTRDDEESLSSMNESAWDMIDERSAASDNEASTEASRIATPMSEAPEPIYAESESLAGNDTSSESPENQGRAAKFSHSRKDSSSDPPDTARPFATAPKRQSILLENQTAYIKFHDYEYPGEQEVSFVLTEFGEAERKKISKEHTIGQNDEIAGVVRQKMGPTGISPSGPFKVMYVGPVEMKETLVNKIASALAASPGFSPRDSLNSSRVTVVPISSFADDSSPDVVLIDSMGIDMNIEECKSAKEDNENITLVMTNHSKTSSVWNSDASDFELPKDYEAPDLAVVYVPARENSAAKMTRSLAREFFRRHKIPVLLISYDTNWTKTPHTAEVDKRLPHLSIEAFNVENGSVSVRVLRRQAVDINTFISIDSAQLSRSLALILSSKLEASSANDISSKLISETPFVPTLKNASASRRSHRRSRSVPYLRIGLIMFSILAMLILRRDQIIGLGRYKTLPGPINRVPEQSLPPATSSVTVSSFVTATVTRTVLPGPSSTATDAIKIPVEELLKDNLYQNKSDKFQAQVVGDSHVVLRAPGWFSRLRSQPELIIKVRRAQKAVPHELSTLFNGVFALKFPPEHAHGSLEITLSTATRPRVHEIFHIELGNPWLKISGWQRAALAMKDHLAEDLFTARVGLLKAYSNTNTRVQHFFKDAIIKADSLIKEAEKVSIGSLTSTLQNTDNLLSQTKSFTISLTDKLRAAALSHTPTLFGAQHDHFSRDLSAYSKMISTMFLSQAKSLSTAASSIVTLGQDIQTYRETHFINEQKRLLQTWWSIFGVPSHLKAKLHEQSRQDRMDEEVWGSRWGSRRAARKARREAKKKARQQRKEDLEDEDEDLDEVANSLREKYRNAVASVMGRKWNTNGDYDFDSDLDE